MISISLKMNQENISQAPELPVKRKRGRPRKDETLQPRPHPPPPTTTTITIQPPPLAATVLPPVDHSMVGQAVTCIIDGVFDNGYLLSTRLGPNNAVLRGIVFQQGHVAPVTPENDVAPHLEMCTRSEFPIPPANPRDPECVKQQGEAEVVAVQNYQNAPQQESLRLVEQDEVMQVFEVSKDCEKEHVESFPGKDCVIPEGNVTGMESEQHGNQDITRMEHEPVVEHIKEPEELQKESEEQIGEVNNNNIDANQAVDLSLSNFSEN